MSAKKTKNAKVVSEMTDIIAKHLEKMPAEERTQRLKAFTQVISRSGKRSNDRSKASSTPRTRQNSHQIQA